MGRPKRTKIHLDKNSLQEFMQEIYNDCVNVANSARKELNERKSRAEIDDINDESLIGKVNNETLKIIDATIDKKLALAKLQSQIVSTDQSNKNNDTKDVGFSEQDKDILRDLFKEKSSSDNIEYDLE
jgi:recombination DNA repair RAD52 pathway protein